VRVEREGPQLRANITVTRGYDHAEQGFWSRFVSCIKHLERENCRGKKGDET